MDLKEMMKMQQEFDSIHGWVWEGGKIEDLLDLINKDLIGLIGEIGEFANLIKKLNLIAEKETQEQLDTHFQTLSQCLAEELIDSFIYLIRIATHLEIDLQKNYLQNIEFNRERYRKYEVDKP